MKAVSLWFAVIVAAFIVSCTTPVQKATYNTLYTVEMTTVAAYDGYIDSVIKKVTSTNSVPKVSAAFNGFQTSFLVALSVARFDTNAVAPASLITESGNVVNLITASKGH